MMQFYESMVPHTRNDSVVFCTAPAGRDGAFAESRDHAAFMDSIFL
jgi:hypothetical protein